MIYAIGCSADCESCGREVDGMEEDLFACEDCDMFLECGECCGLDDGDACPACEEQ